MPGIIGQGPAVPGRDQGFKSFFVQMGGQGEERGLSAAQGGPVDHFQDSDLSHAFFRRPSSNRAILFPKPLPGLAPELSPPSHEPDIQPEVKAEQEPGGFRTMFIVESQLAFPVFEPARDKMRGGRRAAGMEDSRLRQIDELPAGLPAS